MLSWWRHARGENAELRVLLALEDGRLQGIAPFFVERGPLGLPRYRVLAAGTSQRVEPLARAGREREAAAVFAEALARADPRPGVVRFEGVPTQPGWPALLAEAWPGRRRPSLYEVTSRVAPTLRIGDQSYDEWFQSKSKRFRGDMRRSRRSLEERGAGFRLSQGESEIDRDLDAFARLHHARWEWRGGSGVLTPGVETMLRQTAAELSDSGRFRLWCVAAGDHTVSAHVMVVAGGEIGWWLGGFDDDWADQQPSHQIGLRAIEDAYARGDTRLDLSVSLSRSEWKWRFADAEDELVWVDLVPPGLRAPVTRIPYIAKRLRRRVTDRLPDETKDRLKRILRRA
jgi:CelD/BcsL family acetyltransferase involved in cellulose biosynthesis